MRAEAVVEARPRKAVAMRDLDRVDPGLVERGGDRADLLDPVHVPDRVHPVAQGDVLDVEPGAALGIVGGHHTVSFCAASRRSASSSPVALAAAVMMSRLPE